MAEFVIMFSANGKELLRVSTAVACRILRDKFAEDFELDKNEIIVITKESEN